MNATIVVHSGNKQNTIHPPNMWQTAHRQGLMLRRRTVLLAPETHWAARKAPMAHRHYRTWVGKKRAARLETSEDLLGGCPKPMAASSPRDPLGCPPPLMASSSPTHTGPSDIAETTIHMDNCAR